MVKLTFYMSHQLCLIVYGPRRLLLRYKIIHLRWGALYRNSWVAVVQINALKELLKDYMSQNGVKTLLEYLCDEKTMSELMAIGIMGKGFKHFWPRLTCVQKKREFVQNLLDFKVIILSYGP